VAKKLPSTAPRKPPAPADLDAFVEGRKPAAAPTPAPTPAAPARDDVKTPARQDTVRFHQPRKGRDVRRLTVYLPADVATRLAVACAAEDRTWGDVITEAVEGWLRDKGR